MIHLMRKYQKSLLTVLIVLIIGPFVLWGGFSPSSCRSQQAADVAVVATVGNTPISAVEFQEQLNQEAQMRERRTGQRPTFQDLQEDGTAERTLEGIINSTLLDIEVQKLNFNVPRSFLQEILKRNENFKDENGEFSPKLWNAWLDANSHSNWNAIYADLQSDLGRQVLMNRVMAPARVTDEEIRKKFEEEHTKLKIKYVKIDPEIVPTDEQIKQEYDKDPARYQIPEKKTAEFVAVSLIPPLPPLAEELVSRARGGEDFAALAKEHSVVSSAKENGGDMGWTEDSENVPDRMQPLFDVPVGTVSDPIATGNAYYIYKVTGERTDEQTGLRSIQTSQIVLRAELDEDERAKRQETAETVAAKAKETGDLAAAAAEAGLTVQTAQSFSPKSVTIENISKADVYVFRTKVSELAQGEISDLIEAREHLYVAQVTAVEAPVPQPLEAVREDVEKDAINTIRSSPERAQEIDDLVKKITPQVHSLEEVIAALPDIKLEINETEEFTRKDPLYQQGLFVRTDDIFEAVGRKEPGAFSGPIASLMAEQYFIELVSKTPPTDEDWADLWPEEEERLRNDALRTKRNQLLMDYVADLRERVSKQGSPDYMSITRDFVSINKILAPDDTDFEEEDASDETSPNP